MLTISQILPQACLLGAEGEALGQRVAAAGGLWFTADPNDVLVEGEAISGWRARSGRADLRPSAPNQGQTMFQMAPMGFVLRSGLHCGLTLPGALPMADRFTAAVIYAAPDEDIRTILALNTGAERDLIFLSQAEGELLAKNRAGNLTVQLPAPRAGTTPNPAPNPAQQGQADWRLAIVSYSGRGLYLWAGGALAQAQGVAAAMHAPADLFVGCRSNRAGLTKTLGAGLIRDVVLWPGAALLAGPPGPDLAALQRYFRWCVQ